MDKKLMLAVAGAGKTTYLINRLNEVQNSIIVTYTINNYNSIRSAIINKFKYIPSNIKIYTYFSFLYNFCFRPFERNINSKGLQYGTIIEKNAKSNQLRYYMNMKSRKMYAGRLAKLCNAKIIDRIKKRIEKYFKYLFIDEIQDFAGNDFNFIRSLEECNINILYVGDFYQHTFDTSRDGNTNFNIFSNYKNYTDKLKNRILSLDNTSLIKSRRCTQTVCDFVRCKIGIEIYSYENKESIVKEIKRLEEIDEIMRDDKITKLFYNNSNKYLGNTDNWGNSKGKTYNEICVVLNQKTYKLYKENKLRELSQTTRNKLYVACTRTRGNLFFISDKLIENYKKI